MSIINMPKKGPDKKKLKKIREALKKNPQGLWVRKIARETGLDKSMVSIYLRRYMEKEVEVMSVSELVKIYKLRGECNE